MDSSRASTRRCLEVPNRLRHNYRDPSAILGSTASVESALGLTNTRTEKASRQRSKIEEL